MPTADSSRRPRSTWPLPTLDRIEIVYTTEDRFGDERADPHLGHVQYVWGKVAGVVYEDVSETGETRLPVGWIRFLLIDLWEVDESDRSTLFDVLDSAERVDYDALTTERDGLGVIDGSTTQLMLVDAMELIPEARGHGLGLHVLARAIRTWSERDGVVALIAGSIEDVEDESGEVGPSRLKFGETLARYWERLGFERLDPTVATSTLPMLYAKGKSRDFCDLVGRYSRPFTSPSGTGDLP
jgi:GNAT superfamily N-acetyltransferase